jgi:hypothetical protein
MTSRATITMPHSRRRKPATELVDDFATPLPQAADRHAHWMHIVVCRGKFAPAINTQSQNVRLEIWLASWRIAIYDEFGGHPHRLGARW